MKIVLTVVVCLSLIVIMGCALVSMAPRVRYHDDICDDES